MTTPNNDYSKVKDCYANSSATNMLSSCGTELSSGDPSTERDLDLPSEMEISSSSHAHMQAASAGSQANTQHSVVSTPSMKETPLTSRSSASPAKLPQKCPRCESLDTKFCYYNNHNYDQPRYLCKSCRRYWTKGGALRNVPIGGGCRRNKRCHPYSAGFSNVRDNRAAALFNLDALTTISNSMYGSPWLPSPLQIPALQTQTVPPQRQTSNIPPLMQTNNFRSVPPQNIPPLQAHNLHASIWNNNCKTPDSSGFEVYGDNPFTGSFVQSSNSSMRLKAMPSIEIRNALHEPITTLQFPINQLVPAPMVSFPVGRYPDESDMKCTLPMPMGMQNKNDSLSGYQALSGKEEKLPNGIFNEQPLPPPLIQSAFVKNDPFMLLGSTFPCQYPSESKDGTEYKKVASMLADCIPSSSYTNSTSVANHNSSPLTILEPYSQGVMGTAFGLADLDIHGGDEKAALIDHVFKDNLFQVPSNPKVDGNPSQDHGFDVPIPLKEFDELVAKGLNIFEEV
ncbi:hypothetical protein KP509_11G069300 [Ceratopteris richardii]|uniref:Dof-type domain-containing protein n=1 Tax=Ceratopteris richardii TaxID=49495 RepID=A0A8T2TQV1_CERRI|nr:hypothetical protein KP509_11G069300 [Ceratopteris richardii]